MGATPVHDILSLIDRNLVRGNSFRYILVVDDLPQPNLLRGPEEISAAIENSLIDLNCYLSTSADKAAEYCCYVSALFREIEAKAGEAEEGELGGCWLWILDNTHEMTRALVRDERVEVSRAGRYLVKPYEFSDLRSLRQRENMVKQAAIKLKEVFGVECGYFSVLGSDDPNGLPFYNGDHLDNKMFYNVSG